jgi:hypothetical protein
MATGTIADFKIYNEEFYGGYSEALEQNSNMFNSASNNTVILSPNRLKGEYEKEAFFKNIADLVVRRDPTAGTTAMAGGDKKVEADEFIGVKVNRGIGPVAQTLDSWRKIAADPQEFS